MEPELREFIKSIQNSFGEAGLKGLVQASNVVAKDISIRERDKIDS